MITTHEKLTELKAFYSNAALAEKLSTSISSIDKKHPMMSPVLECKIDAVFETHCLQHGESVEIETLVNSPHTSFTLVSTPDGYQPILQFYRKGLRTIYQLGCADGSMIRCSNDHLIETTDGWVKAESVEMGDLVITKTGYSPINHVVSQAPEVVFDFEVGHDNHRYWSGGISSHNSGKSFISANLVAAAQKDGAYCLVIDSENALDDEFMSKIGVDTENNYKYVSVTTIPEVTKIVSSFLQKYKDQVGEAEDAPQVLILIDSLDMLMTETEVDHFSKGNTKGDQGQKNKQLKAMLRTFVQAIKSLNVAMICTSQVYKNQDILNGEGVWIVSDAVKYAASQIILIQKRKLKDESAGAKVGDVAGVRMICEGYKTRFTRPFQRVEVEVPYETGMDPYSGLMDVAKAVGVVKLSGSWYTLKGSDKKMRADELIANHADEIIAMLEQETTAMLDLESAAEVDTSPPEKSTKQLRKDKFDAASTGDE